MTAERALPEGMPGSLYEALARFQAELPQVDAARTGHVDPRDQGKQGYDFGYADLDDVSRVALPALGALGLAWLTKPEWRDRTWGLAYALVHWPSGDREDGFYELPATADLPQRGKLLSYARRQALCAVTGIAPRRAEQQPRSGRRSGGGQRDEWAESTRARPRQDQQDHRDQRDHADQRDGAGTPDRRVWLEQALDRAGKFAGEAAGDRLWQETAEKRADGEITPDEARPVFARIIDRRQQLGDEKAARILARDDDWRDHVAGLADLAAARKSLADTGADARAGRMDTDLASRVSKAIVARFPKAAQPESETTQ